MDHPAVEHHASICVLAPAYQRLQELTALLNHPRLMESLEHSPIKEIQRREDAYLITNEKGTQIVVFIHYFPRPYCGAPRFELEFPEDLKN